MPELVVPHQRLHRSFVAAMEEFRAEGRGGPADLSMVGNDLRAYGDLWDDPAVFAAYLDGVLDEARPGAVLPEGRVPCTTWWYADGDTYLGRLALRHRLTPFLRDIAGHIGYDVRPTARRRGHATAMLRTSLPRAAALGIDPVLVTCDHDNTGSRKVIEACGGVFEDRRGEKLRYWVPAGTA